MPRHALLEEFCRQNGHDLKPEFFRRCQREFRDDVQPILEDYDRLQLENADLKAQIEKAKKKAV